ncbi:hypothetical protein HMPREF9163_01350 [Selenomonas sp. oral taxon 138 str. F0429]|nr:hypothetical protein HMPREF9163_01350 [Selenomonas sp. oral taxon 138 str. F0429]
MLMAVRMRWVNARRLDAPQLCRELRAYLAQIDCTAQDAHGQRSVIIDEDTCLRDERGNLGGRQDGIAVDERQMDADTEFGCPPRERCRIVKCRAAGHDGCRAQDAVVYAALHGAVDERVPTEIVGVQNDLLQVVVLMSFIWGACFPLMSYANA